MEDEDELRRRRRNADREREARKRRKEDPVLYAIEREKARVKYARDREYILERFRTLPHLILYNYKKAAKHNNREWGITDELAYEFFRSKCHYCETTPELLGRPMGIDRKDNDEAYTVTNVVPCCNICNLGKHVLPYEVYVAHIQRIRDRNSKYQG